MREMLGHASRAYTMADTLHKHFFANRKIEKSLISFLVDGADFNKPTQKGERVRQPSVSHFIAFPLFRRGQSDYLVKWKR